MFGKSPVFRFIYDDESKSGLNVSSPSCNFSTRKPLNITEDDVFTPSRFGIGTQPQDVRISSILFEPSASSLPLHTKLTVDDLSHDLGGYGDKNKWHMFTLIGINFIQNNGLANAENFENLTNSIFKETIITNELLTILEFSTREKLLIPNNKWNKILANCERGRII